MTFEIKIQNHIALVGDYRLNPPNHKWHLIRKKSSAKRKFIERNGFSLKYIPVRAKHLFRLKHPQGSRAGLSTQLLTSRLVNDD